MGRRLDNLNRRATAVLCIIAMAHQVCLTGCNTPRLEFPLTAAMYQIRLSADHELSKSLQDTAFRDATGVEIFPAEQAFRITFPEADKQIAGTYAYVNGEFTITGFSFGRNGESVSLDLSEAKQITRIAISDGAEWNRPPESLARAIPSTSARGVDAYAAANADILEFARELDQAGGSADGSKRDTALLVVLGGILFTAAVLWAGTSAALQVLLAIFAVSVVLQNVMLFRFDGNWTASNAGSNLGLTIENGRITRLTDENAAQEFTIVKSDIQNVVGTNVFWTVEAQVDGQAVPVIFQFDMQEMASGQLEGTLTVTGNTLGRVPATMTRIN